jgi:DNA-binding PadR family transcriptional regulator
MAESIPNLNPFEIFLLFCVKTGMESPYAILTKTGVGVGASSPALKRLEGSGFVTSTPGPRNRLTYSLTPTGEASLRNSLKAGPSAYGRYRDLGIYDTLHRVIFFGWVKGKLEEASTGIDKAEDGLKRALRRATAVVDECRIELTVPSGETSSQTGCSTPEHLANVYKYIKAAADAAEANQQIVALSTLRRLITELPPTPKTFLQDSRHSPQESTEKV